MALKLSVIMGNFNKAPFIPLMLESVLNQTRPADEIVIIDDASTDDSIEVISRYLPRHPNMRLIRNPKNQGPNRNVSRMIRIVESDIVFFASSDDLLYPELFERGMQLFEAHPDAGLFSGRCDFMDMKDRVIGLMPSPMPLDEAGYLSPQQCAETLMRDGEWTIGLATLWHRRHLIDEGGFRPDLGSIADGVVSHKLVLKYGACFSPNAMAAWRRSESGAAWDNSINIAAARRISDLGKAAMLEAGELFPANYPERWRKRYMFGAQRLQLSELRKGAARGGFPARAAAMLHEAVMTLWLLLTLRPYDILPIIKRRLHKANYGKATR